jgi:hypothetical protein
MTTQNVRTIGANDEELVAGDGIEPPTRGFSIGCDMTQPYETAQLSAVNALQTTRQHVSQDP